MERFLNHLGDSTFVKCEASCDEEGKYLVEDVLTFLLKEPCLFSHECNCYQT